MTSEHCQKAVEAAIGQLEGVQSVRVNLKAGEATLLGNVTDLAVREAVVAAGYEAFPINRLNASLPFDKGVLMNSKVKPIVIGVGGMTCAACIRRVENGLRMLPSVIDVSVNLATERASIQFDHIPSEEEKQVVRDSIAKLG